ncbi:unnamed protein product, partial [Protopolystoma xenopodis]
MRLQSTSSTDLAFISEQEVDVQLHSQTVEAGLIWARLQSRLGHLGFLRNAHLSAVSAGRAAYSGSGCETSKSDASPLECPTCLLVHSPARPTFVLLPGCWHSLCLVCYNRINGAGSKTLARRCPVCRTPFTETPGDQFGCMSNLASSRAFRRRPITLVHFSQESGPPTVTQTSPGVSSRSVISSSDSVNQWAEQPGRSEEISRSDSNL